MLKGTKEEKRSLVRDWESAGSTALVSECFCPHPFPSHCFLYDPSTFAYGRSQRKAGEGFSLKENRLW